MNDQLAASLWREASDLEDAGMLDAAIEKYELAVREGSVDAMINLGNILDDKISPPETRRAIDLYEAAVKQGSGVAAWNLAKHYENVGNDVERVKWIGIAAKLGDEDAQALLGSLG